MAPATAPLRPAALAWGGRCRAGSSPSAGSAPVIAPGRCRRLSPSAVATAPLLLLAAVALLVAPGRAQSYFEACDGQYEQVVDSVVLRSGETATREIQANYTHQFVYTNYNLSTIEQNETQRKLIISLEPCYGVVYLFVRKNIPCHPDPYSCIDLETGFRDFRLCRRTHFMSDINGTRDGAPTFFQISLSATQYYISVFAAEDSRYALTVVDDIGAWPRRGNSGIVQAAAISEGTAMLQWRIAEYFPVGVSETLQYHVYSVPLVENDTMESDAVFLRPSKILNTNCGLLNNTDSAEDTISPELCDNFCNTTLTGLTNGRTYAFNVVAESTRGFRMAYAGTIFEAAFSAVESVGGAADAGGAEDAGAAGARRLKRREPTYTESARRLMEASSAPMDNKDMQVVGAVMGSVLGMVGMAGMVLLRYAT